MKRRILFVDDQEELLRGTRRMLFNYVDDWEIEFASSGKEALEKLSEARYDILVSDMKMPGMDGVSLLSVVAKQYPAVIRMILSGYAQNDLVFKTVGNTHQFLAKPIDKEHLVDILKRAVALRELLKDERLSEIIGGLDSIPSLPNVFQELMGLLMEPGHSMHEIGHVISKDVAMSAKIMQMVNSAFFGLPVQVKSPVHAVNLLGVEVIKALVVSVHVFKSFDNQLSKRFSIEEFNNHSLSVGTLAKAIAVYENQPQNIVDDAFIAGMLHDVGKLIVVSNFPTYYDESTAYAESHGLTYVYGEEAVYHTTHAEIGAYQLGLWGFRDNIVEAVAFHHRPIDSLGTSFSPLTAVHIADAMENEYGNTGENPIAQVHVDYLMEQGLMDKLDAWREVCFKTKHSLLHHDDENTLC